MKISMTRFFCQELLYDYITGELTPERRAEVEAFLKTDEVCREDLARIKKAIGYCEQLAQVKTPDEWVARWQNLPPALAKRISNWEYKIVAKLWLALPYTVSVTVIALGLVIFKPWRKLYRRDVIVWSAATQSADENTVTKVAAVLPPPAPPTLPPINNTSKDVHKVAEESKESILKSEELGPPENTAEEVTTIFGPPREAKAKPTAVASVAEVNDESLEDKPSPSHGAPKGELYRWFLDTDDLENVTNEIKAKIVALHGEKARKVELGWHSKDDESYFHFTLPESNSDELVKYIKTFGPVRMLKEKHPVVMPPGKMRIILIVKEDAEAHKDDATDSNDDEETEAPKVP